MALGPLGPLGHGPKSRPSASEKSAFSLQKVGLRPPKSRPSASKKSAFGLRGAAVAWWAGARTGRAAIAKWLSTRTAGRRQLASRG